MLEFLWTKLAGWKSAIGYLLLQIPLFSEQPLLLEAVQKAIAEPSNANIAAAIAHLILAIGILDRIRRNLKG